MVPTFVIHGEWDGVVPFCTASSAARRSGGELVRVKRAGHSWLLKDPETLPLIVEELLQGELGMAVRNAISGAGAGTTDELEEELYEQDARILGLTPELRWTPIDETHRKPRYRWSVAPPS